MKFLRDLIFGKTSAGDSPVGTKTVKTVVDIRRLDTPVIYKTRTVLYDAWGDPYVKFGRSIDNDCKLLPGGRIADYPYRTEWRIKSGPPVTFSNFNPSTGWHPDEITTQARIK